MSKIFKDKLITNPFALLDLGAVIDLWANVKYYDKPIYCETEKIEGIIFKGCAMLGETTYSIDIVNDFLAEYSLEIKEKMTNDQITTFYNKKTDTFVIVHKPAQPFANRVVTDYASVFAYWIFHTNTPQIFRRIQMTKTIIDYLNKNHCGSKIHLQGYSLGGYSVCNTFVKIGSSYRDKIERVITYNSITNCRIPLGGYLSGPLKEEFGKKVIHKRIEQDISTTGLYFIRQNAHVVTYRIKPSKIDFSELSGQTIYKTYGELNITGIAAKFYFTHRLENFVDGQPYALHYVSHNDIDEPCINRVEDASV